MKEAVVISLSKPGDPTDLGNTRGISLICVALKLLGRIVSARIVKHLESQGGICREQAGFRTEEECVAQVVSLMEIANRRKHGREAYKGSAPLSPRGTYVAFIDLKKSVRHCATQCYASQGEG